MVEYWYASAANDGAGRGEKRERECAPDHATNHAKLRVWWILKFGLAPEPSSAFAN
jgi:hypothetical protein